MKPSSEQIAFLEEPHVAVLATVDRQDRPHAMPIWYMLENDTILMSVAQGSQKHRNLERNPNATLVIDRRATPYYAVMLRGVATLGPPISREQHERLASRYLGADAGRRYAERTYGHDVISIRLTTDDWIEFHGQAGRSG